MLGDEASLVLPVVAVVLAWGCAGERPCSWDGHAAAFGGEVP